jgi:hemerythrin-like domain-containing protein
MDPFAYHPVIENSLDTLEALVQRVVARDPKVQDREDARRVLDCFDRVAPLQHRDEEQTIFPSLRRRAAISGRPEVGGALYELEMEHDKMERMFASLRPGIERIAKGAAPDLRPEAVAHFAWLYRRHLRVEAQVLAPFVQEVRA